MGNQSSQNTDIISLQSNCNWENNLISSQGKQYQEFSKIK